MRTIFAFIFFLILTVTATAQDDSHAQTQTQANRVLQRLQERERFLLQEYSQAESDVDRHSIEERTRSLVKEYESFIKDNPDNVPATVAFGMLLSRIGERDYAFRVFTRANNLDGEIPQVHNQLGNFMIEDGFFEIALGHYLTAIRLAPDEPLYHYQLGNLLYFFQKELVAEEVYSESELPRMIFDSFQKAAELAPTDFGYQYRFGEAYYDHPRPDLAAAQAQWMRVLKLAGDERETQMTYLHLANVYAMQGEGDKVFDALEKVNLPEFNEQKEEVEATLKAFYQD